MAKKEMSEAEALAKELTERQLRFVEELLIDGNATEAAKRAGYSEASAASQASRLLRNDKVAAYRRARTQELYNKLGVTHAWVGLRLTEIVERCMAAKPHLSWDSERHAWVEDGTWIFDARGATNALKAIGESLGMFKERPIQAEGGGESIEEFLERASKPGEGRRF